MEKNVSDTAKKYIITAVFGAVIAFAVMFFQGIFALTDRAEVMKIISNGFLVAAVILCGSGLLTWSAAAGTFDMIAYGAHSFYSLFRSGQEKKYKDFYDYREAKSASRRPLWYLSIVGGICLFIAVVFTVLFYLI